MSNTALITEATRDAVLDQIIDAEISVKNLEKSYAIYCLKKALDLLEGDDGSMTELGAHLNISKILSPRSLTN